MGILNASPDSFSDGGDYPTLAQQLQRARRLVQDGASILDIGGESARTDQPAITTSEEIERVVPLIERVVSTCGCAVSVDTYKPEVARAAIAAGASLINDISGLRDVRLASVARETGAALVIMHNLGVPKRRLLESDLYNNPATDVLSYISDRMKVALDCGVRADQIVVDPGPDFSKTPSQTVDVLRNLSLLAELGRPVLLAVSRKDFIGALTRRRPRERLPGTLAAIEHGVAQGARILRVHDVAAVVTFLQSRHPFAHGARETV